MQAYYLFFKMFITASGRILRAFINNLTIKCRGWRKEKKSWVCLSVIFRELYQHPTSDHSKLCATVWVAL